MTSGRFYATVMPIAGILYMIALFVSRSSQVAFSGAMIFALLGVVESMIGRANK